MRTPRIDTQHLDQAGFEAWLREQLPGVSFGGVVTVVLQLIRALVRQNTELRMRIAGRRPKPPTERLEALERQLSFPFAVPSNDLVPTTPSSPAPTAEPAPDARKEKTCRKRTSRGRVPRNITTIEVPNDVPADERWCADCGVEMTRFRQRCVETIEVIPARIIVKRRVDEIVACPHCDRIACAKAPPGILDGGRLGPTLVTESLCSKVLDGMPIERQARHFQREGVPIAASTLGRSVSALLALLVPLADRIFAQVKRSARAQLDATGLRVLDARAATGIYRDTLWTLIGDGRWVSFAPLESGDADAVEKLLAGAEAESWQSDGTHTLSFLEKRWQKRRPGCHAHGRRRLVEAARRGDLRAMEGLRIYARLFAIEKEASREGLDVEALQRRREERSLPVLEELRAWVLRTAPSVEPKSVLGEGLTYLQRQWLRLCLYVFDGATDITNNRSERELRPWILGQHTWLFVGDQLHAQRWAAAFSIVHTALAHGVNPRAYLHAVVEKILAGHPHTRLGELLPDAMLRERPELADPLGVHRRAPTDEPAQAA